MSSMGSGWFDPFEDDANWGNSNAPSTTGVNVSPSSRVGLFGGQYADMMANVARSGLAEQLFGGPADLSGDGSGLRPSVTIAPYLPQLRDPHVSRAQDGFSLPAPAGAQPIVSAGPGSAIPAPFSLYDWIHDQLNRPGPSKLLQSAQDVSQSLERNGAFAAGLGATGAGIGAVTVNPIMEAGSDVLFAIGAGADLAGKLGDMGTSFLKSIQQGTGRPLGGFERRAIPIWKFQPPECIIGLSSEGVGGRDERYAMEQAA